MTTLKNRLAAILLCTLLPSVVAAQEPELVTDRPDQTESAVTVPRGRTQVEVGAGFGSDGNGADVETLTIGSTLVRLGWTDRLELRLGWQGYVDTTIDFHGQETSVDGLGDGELGLKWLVAEARGGRPQVALLVATSVPYGDDQVTGDEFDPSFRFAVDYELTESIGLGVNLGVSWQSVDAGGSSTSRRSSGIYTAAVGFPLGERTGAFVEVYGEVPLSAAGSSAHSFDGGVTYLLRDNVQFDLAGGVGLSDAAEDWFIGVGLSIRFPR